MNTTFQSKKLLNNKYLTSDQMCKNGFTQSDAVLPQKRHITSIAKTIPCTILSQSLTNVSDFS